MVVDIADLMDDRWNKHIEKRQKDGKCIDIKRNVAFRRSEDSVIKKLLIYGLAMKTKYKKINEPLSKAWRTCTALGRRLIVDVS